MGIRLSRPVVVLVLALGVLVAAVITISVLNNDNATAGPAQSAKASKATALAGEAPLGNDSADINASERLDTPEKLQAVADQLATSIPLPTGGNFDNIDWKAIGSTSAEGAQSFLEYNASCQWDKAWLAARANGDERAAADALAVLSQIPSWPSFRGTESGKGAQAQADAAAAGDAKPVEAQVAANCS